MIYTDRIYGKVKIDEPVILKLVKSPVLQRLKGVDQAGYRSLWVKPKTVMGKCDHSRFAHSLGVYIHQDNIFEEFIFRTEIPKILEMKIGCLKKFLRPNITPSYF